jgi:hypothetical protein
MVEHSVEVILVDGSVGRAMIRALRYSVAGAFHNEAVGLWMNQRPLVVGNASFASGCACIIVLGTDEIEQVLMRTRASLRCCWKHVHSALVSFAAQ